MDGIHRAAPGIERHGRFAIAGDQIDVLDPVRLIEPLQEFFRELSRTAFNYENSLTRRHCTSLNRPAIVTAFYFGDARSVDEPDEFEPQRID
jgi:hypothetical protein